MNTSRLFGTFLLLVAFYFWISLVSGAQNATFGEVCQFNTNISKLTCNYTQSLDCHWNKTCVCASYVLKWSKDAKDCLTPEGHICALPIHYNFSDLSELLNFHNAAPFISPLYLCDYKFRCVNISDKSLKNGFGVCCHPKTKNCHKSTEPGSFISAMKITADLGDPCDFKEYSRVAKAMDIQEYNRLQNMDPNYPKVICGDLKNTNLECQADNKCHCLARTIKHTGDFISNVGYCSQSFEETIDGCFIKENFCCETGFETTAFTNAASTVKHFCTPGTVCEGIGKYGRCRRMSSHEGKEFFRHKRMGIQVSLQTGKFLTDDPELRNKTELHHRMLYSRADKVTGNRDGVLFYGGWLVIIEILFGVILHKLYYHFVVLLR